jgi:UDPglucose--hexose-1-phosphate uridylyltransferase
VEQRRGLFSEIIANEQSDGRRILLENESAISFVPYFARFPYEVYVAPKREMQNVAGLRNDEVDCFASCLLDVVIRFDNLWSSPFPYVLVLHQAPVDRTYDGFHFHIELHPPLRSPGLLKYLSGPEIGGGNFLNSSSPEEKAAELKSQSTIHYLA